MNPKIILLAILLSMGGASLCLGQARNGYWWEKLSGKDRAAYTLGLLDGMVSGQAMHYDAESAKVSAALSADTQAMFKGADSLQVMKKIDEFYQAPRNRVIKVPAAAWLVAIQVRMYAHPEMKSAFEKAVEEARQDGRRP